MDAYEAVVTAGVERFRPILLTTLTTIVGLTPMMLERSIQAAFLKPVVISLAFGVALAFFVTLFLVPAMFTIGVDISRSTARLRDRVAGWFGDGHQRKDTEQPRIDSV
jgi:Cu/Ag efflux pump CusA